jgi:hypothetical protein
MRRRLVLVSRQLLALDDPLPNDEKLAPESASSGDRWRLGIHFGLSSSAYS